MPRLIKQGFIGMIGNTPLIRIGSLSEATGCNILAKAEFLNPGGSVKDRAALFVVEENERAGLLKPGGIVVEGTAGNTGIGLAHVCAAKGYKCVVFMPNTQSREKIQALQFLGADVRPVPAVAFSDPLNYNHQARDYATKTPNAVWTNQFDNVSNRLAHIKTTGPEIWEQTEGNIDAFTCATGTGGTLAGIPRLSSCLRNCTNARAKHQERPFTSSKRTPISRSCLPILLAVSSSSVSNHSMNPSNVCCRSFVKNGVLEREGAGSVTEGIGQGRVTDNLKDSPIDDAVHIEDRRSIEMVQCFISIDCFVWH
ncbi:hypothetical protein, variant 2 [Aphanomyces invadans]|uniref:Cysteine synthase 1 n=1 Tax=Aphanomyces invadans TaxID=157072 RepID=A0A024UVG3_9STRA|nr:hypothetical protein, variant 2 [Aphanomyces invadans]ETW10516.1 hypothetical protein, variant 2 [Aphanomyces invadans]|eukprot:XP_008861928.1 hypothetical protein, variant 2 [Aphanomyces invadans]